jgi:hypothetical protein
VSATVDGATRPVARGGVDAIEIADEVLVYLDGAIHRLNPTAALVWVRSDGTVDVDTLAAEFAAASGVPVDRVRDDVVRTIEQLRTIGLVGVIGEPVPVPVPVVEPAPACSGCGPGPGYERQVLVRVDDGVLAVGADATFAESLHGALGDRALGVVDDPVTRAGYGVVLPAPGASGSRHDLARLHRGPDVLARHRRPEPVVRALLAQIGIHALPPGHVPLEAMVVGDDHGVVVMPVPPRRPRFARAMEARGLGVSIGSVVVLASDGRSVHLDAPWLDADADALAAAVADRAWSEVTPVLDRGVHEVVAVGASAPTTARVFGEMAPTTGPATGRAALDAVRALAAAVPVVDAADPEAVVAALRGRAGR